MLSSCLRKIFQMAGMMQTALVAIMPRTVSIPEKKYPLFFRSNPGNKPPFREGVKKLDFLEEISPIRGGGSTNKSGFFFSQNVKILKKTFLIKTIFCIVNPV